MSRYRGAYMKAKPLLTWALFVCLILLWGFNTVTFENKILNFSFIWDFKDTFFGANIEFASITIIMWFLSMVLMLYYLKYQAAYHVKSAIYITTLAIFAMVIAIILHQADDGLSYGSSLQSLVQGVYLGTMTVIVAIRMYQINFLPVWQDKMMFLTFPSTKPLINEDVQPQLLNEYSGKVVSPLHWCAYECVGRARQFLPRGWSGHFKVSYIGEVDEALRPHGFGEWWDTSYHGEHLVGLWQAGKPIGPFKSREKGSSSGFKNFRICYFMNRADPLDKRLCCPAFGPDGEVKYGMLSVECSVSGVFFKDYPRTTLLDGPHVWERNTPFLERMYSFRDKAELDQRHSSGKSNHDPCQQLDATVQRQHSALGETQNSWIIQRMERSPSLKRNARTDVREDTIVVSAHPQRGLVVSGYEKVEAKPKSLPSSIGIKLKSSSKFLDETNDWATTGLEVVGWEPKTNYQKFEAIVFIHGFNAAVTDAARVFGQFLALTNLPPYFKPIIFSWPAGREFSYYQARLIGVESSNTQDAFIELMHFLAADGFSRVHIMAHSIGARVITCCAPRLEKIVQGVGPKQPGMLPLKIASITLLSPDCELEPFRETLGHKFRSMCPLVTIYGDRTDQALAVAEVANWAIDFFVLRDRRIKTVNSNSTCSMSDSKVDSEMGVQRTTSRGMGSTSLEGQDKSQGLGSRIEKVLMGAFPEQTKFVFSVFGKSTQKFEFMKKKAKKVFRGLTADLRLKNLGRVTDQVTDAATGEPLDIDVIDTSYMDANVQPMRHNYFNLNHGLVEDIRDLLVTQRRAHQRTSRLEWLGGNVFAFLVAPSHVVNP